MSTPIIRTSERKLKKRCGQAWYWAYREGLRKNGQEAVPLWFGTGIHECLAQWYERGSKRGVHPADYWLDWVGEEERHVRTATNDDYNKDVWIDAHALGEAMMVGYVEKYGADDHWDVISTEQPFQLDIPYPEGPGVYPGDRRILAIYAGTFDGAYRDLRDDTIWLMEHKTAKTISTAHLPLDDQAGAYWAVATKVLIAQGLLKKGEKISGIMYNFLRKGMPDERDKNDKGEALNKNGSVSKNQPSPLFVREPVYRDRRERATQLRRIQVEALDMEFARNNPDMVTKNPTMDCSWGCAFFEMCQLHEKGGDDWKEFRDGAFKVQDPYADHRKSAEE